MHGRNCSKVLSFVFTVIVEPFDFVVDAKTRQWTFPVKEYFNCKKTLSVLKPHVLVGDLPKCVIEVISSA